MFTNYSVVGDFRRFESAVPGVAYYVKAVDGKWAVWAGIADEAELDDDASFEGLSYGAALAVIAGAEVAGICREYADGDATPDELAEAFGFGVAIIE